MGLASYLLNFVIGIVLFIVGISVLMILSFSNHSGLGLIIALLLVVSAFYFWAKAKKEVK